MPPALKPIAPPSSPEIPLPSQGLAKQFLGTEELFLADRKNLTLEGTKITVPYANQTLRQASGDSQVGGNRNDIPLFEATGHVQYDHKEKRWQISAP